MFIESIVEFLQSQNTILVDAFLFLFCMCSIVCFTKVFKLLGLYMYVVIGIIVANIQVLKAVYIYSIENPIPLGGVVFASLFLVSDIITEIYGKKEADRSVWIGFASYLVFSLMMIFTVGLKPLDQGANYGVFRDTHDAMQLLFTPSLAILVSSLVAYAVGMWTDIFI